MHLGEYCSNQVELLTSIAAGKTNLASVAGCKTEADSPAGHKRKHDAHRAGTRVCVSGEPISEEYKALRKCVEALYLRLSKLRLPIVCKFTKSVHVDMHSAYT